jgi:hypothetical protein
MAADPIVYCLEQLTGYEQFERLFQRILVSVLFFAEKRTDTNIRRKKN